MAVKRVVDISEAEERHVALQEGAGQLSKEGMIFYFTCIEMFDEEEALEGQWLGAGGRSVAGGLGHGSHGLLLGPWQPGRTEHPAKPCTPQQTHSQP